MADKKSALVQFALGPVNMIFHAIRLHRMQHEGKVPQRIELHPVVMADLRSHLGSEYLAYAQSETGEVSYMGVRIVEDAGALQPRLITADNQTEYL